MQSGYPDVAAPAPGLSSWPASSIVDHPGPLDRPGELPGCCRRMSRRTSLRQTWRGNEVTGKTAARAEALGPRRSSLPHGLPPCRCPRRAEALTSAWCAVMHRRCRESLTHRGISRSVPSEVGSAPTGLVPATSGSVHGCESATAASVHPLRAYTMRLGDGSKVRGLAPSPCFRLAGPRSRRCGMRSWAPTGRGTRALRPCPPVPRWPRGSPRPGAGEDSGGRGAVSMPGQLVPGSANSLGCVGLLAGLFSVAGTGCASALLGARPWEPVTRVPAGDLTARTSAPMVTIPARTRPGHLLVELSMSVVAVSASGLPVRLA